MKAALVPLLLFVSSVLMALAWLGHIRYRKVVGFARALLVSWFLVLLEYVFNIVAFRWGQGTYSGAAMASFNLCTGVVCVALVARYVLGERLTKRQVLGFALMALAVVLVVSD
jgi:uncharacterized protein (DUF486 family)